jgi:hypothetical protein
MSTKAGTSCLAYSLKGYRFLALKLTAFGATRPALALAKPDGFAPALAAPPFIDARSLGLSFLLFVMVASFVISRSDLG